MQKTFSLFLKIVSGLLLLVFVSLVALVWFIHSRKTELKELAVAKINEHLKVPIKLEDSEISLTQHFPAITLTLKSVTIADPLAPDSLNAVSIGTFTLFFKAGDILFGHYRIGEIKVQNANIHLYIDEFGRKNFDLLRKKTDINKDTLNKTKGSLKLSFSKFILEDVTLSYRDKSKKTFIHLFFNRIDSRLLANEDSINAHLQGSILTHELTFQRLYPKPNDSINTYLKDKELDLNLFLKIDNTTQELTLLPSIVSTDSNHFRVSANLKLDSTQMLEARIEGHNVNPKKALTVIPMRFSKPVEDYEFGKNFNVLVRLFGTMKRGNPMGVSVRFETDSATISKKGTHHKLEHTRISGMFSTGYPAIAENLTLSIYEFEASLAHSKIKLCGELRSAVKPHFNLDVDADVDLRYIGHLIPLPTVILNSGRLKIHTHFSGYLKDWKKQGTHQNTKGTISAYDISGRYKLNDLPIRNGMLSAYFDKNHLVVDSAYLESGLDDIKVKGRVQNFASLIFGGEEVVKSSIQIQSRQFHLDYWLQRFKKRSNLPDSSNHAKKNSGKHKESKKTTAFAGTFVNDVQIICDRLYYNGAYISDVYLKASSDSNGYKVPSLKAKSKYGNLDALASLSIKRDRPEYLKTKINFSGLNLPSVKKALEDHVGFLKNVKRIEGIVESQLQFECGFNEKKKIDLQNFKLKSGLKIRNINIRYATDSSIIIDSFSSRLLSLGIQANPKEFKIMDLFLALSEGSWHTHAQVPLKNGVATSIALQSSILNMRLSKFLRSFNDFNQELVTHDKLHGHFNAYLDVSLPIKDQKPVMSALKGYADYELYESELKDFVIFKKVADHVLKIFKLDDITFSDIAGRVDFYGDHYYVHPVAIRSNRIDMVIEGTYYSVGTVNFHVKVPLKDLDKKDPTWKPEEDPELGFHLSFTISGPVNNLKVTPGLKKSPQDKEAKKISKESKRDFNKLEHHRHLKKYQKEIDNVLPAKDTLDSLDSKFLTPKI
jgi:hypothetical protein